MILVLLSTLLLSNFADASVVPPSAFTWNADVRFVNFNEEQEEKVRKAIAIIKKVITSEEFRERVVNHTWNGKKTYVDNKGLSNQEIYDLIFKGAEIIGDTTANNTLNVELELYTSTTTTIGYTYPSTTRIWMNTKYFNKYTPVKVSDNLMHEWMHKLGFDHAMKWSEERDHTVPYAIGYIIEDLANKHL
ncbi:MAG: hypothetical protein ACJ76H_11965 [Bacteriovoracaceae bacterium]